MSSQPLWVPSAERVANAHITRFREHLGVEGFDGMHRVSIDDPDRFWRAVWDTSGVIGDAGTNVFVPGATMRSSRFFPEARLNFAENLLRQPNDTIAIIETSETGSERVLTRRELHALVARIAAAMRAEGVQPGDRVAAWMSNVAETVAIMLAAASIGAVFSSTSPDFGAAGVVDRFGQIEPVLLFAVDGYSYAGKTHDCLERLGEVIAQLPSLRRTIVVNRVGDTAVPSATRFVDWLETHAEPDAELTFASLPFDHPLAILYSSGTTGVPKCIVHRAGGILLKHLAEHRLQCDVRPGDRVMYFTTCGWMMWNWLVSALASDAAIVLYDGSPFHPTPNVLFDIAHRHEVTLLGVGAKFIDSLRGAGEVPNQSHDLNALRTICSTGSPLVEESFDYVYDAIAPAASRDVHLASISGGTDLCGCLVMGDPTRPVFRGEIQGPALGIAAEVWDDDAQPTAIGERGELVCTRAFPSMPLGFWNDPDGERYRRAYFDRFAGHGRDVWAHGDFAATTAHGGFVIHGRSDATLNPGGVRIGTAEIYRQVEAIDGIAEALAIGQPWGDDVRIVLFVRPRSIAALAVDGRGHPLLAPALVEEIRARIRTNCSPRHVPSVVLGVADLPRTRSGKLAELAVGDIVAGREVRNREALANPESLELFSGRPELQA